MRQGTLRTVLSLLLLICFFHQPAQASTDWPEDVSIESDAGIVMDSASGTILWGKNIHETYSPASITKVLTAAIVLERCDLNETVTFSRNAVYNVEEGSTSAGYDTGDQATVRECLYALLLKSANESANALAEHISGSTEEFAVLMNEKAKELGCQDSHFANPSGLNDEDHYVSAYDMALITRYAFRNDTFREIVSTTYYELSPNAQNPNGMGISPGNKLVKKNSGQYRADALGGKTGYTSIALNTLVNGARQGDTELITVVLHSRSTQYDDTNRLLDFGFENFRSLSLEEYDTTFSSLGKGLTIAGLPTSERAPLTVDPDSSIILPDTADFDETVSVISYDLPALAPENAVASITYSLGDRQVGTAWLTLGAAGREEAPLPEALLEIKPSAIDRSGETSEYGEDSPEAGEGQPDGLGADGLNTGRLETDGLEAGNSGADSPEAAASLTETAEGNGAAEGLSEAESPQPGQAGSQAPEQLGLSLPFSPVLLAAGAAVLILAALAAAVILFIRNSRRREAEDRERRRQKRLERLKESGVSEDEFREMMNRRKGLSIPLPPDHPSRQGSSPPPGSSLLPSSRQKRGKRSGFSLKEKHRKRR